MKTSLLLSVATALTMFSATANAQSINQQLTCHAHLSHLYGKLDNLTDKYDATSLKAVKQGIEAYADYLERDYISPAMEQYASMAEQINQMQGMMIESFDKKFPQPRFFMDHAVMLDNCYKQYKPTSGSEADNATRNMITTVAKLAQSH